MDINELEKLRKKIVLKKITIYLIYLALYPVFIILCNQYFKTYVENGAGIAVYVVGIVFFIVFATITDNIVNKKNLNFFIRKYKERFVENTFKQVFDNFTYEPNQGLSKERFRETNILEYDDIYSSNDYMQGTYHNTSFEIADVEIKEEHTSTDSDGHRNTYYLTVFLGKWFIFNFNKNFKNNLQIVEKDFKTFNEKNWGNEKLHKLELESVSFNKDFKVYCHDDHEAFYILTPNFMNNIENLCKKTKGYIVLGFMNNQLHIGLNTLKDSFEPNIFKKIDENVISNEVNNNIKEIITFIDELDLDNNLFKEN